MEQIKAKESVEQKIDVPRKHVSVADVRRSLNIEKKVTILYHITDIPGMYSAHLLITLDLFCCHAIVIN